MSNPAQTAGRRDVYTGASTQGLSAFAARDAELLGRSTNGFSDIGCRIAGTRRDGVLRFDGQRRRIRPGSDSDAPEPPRRKRTP